MISELARFANDSYHIFKAPTGSKPSLFRGLLFPGDRRMGFLVSHFDAQTLNFLYREVFVRQPYYFHSKSESPVILDCGANIGMASLYFKWLYPKARLQSFEPDPATFQLLQKNIERNNLDVVAHNCALWDDETEVDFFVDPGNPGGLLMSTDPGRWYREPIRVPARKLSSFIDGAVDFLKLDVEGAEHRVLSDLVQSGALGVVRQMVVEYHHKIGQQKSCLADFLHQLERAGFEYQIHASLFPVSSRDIPQDVLIAAYR
jgi:FkbM family methyltransferase